MIAPLLSRFSAIPYFSLILGVGCFGILTALSWRAAPLFKTAERLLRRADEMPRASLAVVAAFSLAISAALVATLGLPKPNVHDEFSYLLAADTFAHGRLTNPTHPQWMYFESEHIIHQPTYMSKYPPGQGLALALGQKLAGLPIIGAWLSVALGCSALAWMLMAWLPPRQAILGGLLSALHPMIIAWTYNYRGGGVAFAGGALLYGSVARTLQRPKVSTSVLIGLGLAMLANSRPFEGLLISIPPGILLLRYLAQRCVRKLGLPWATLIAPLLCVLSLTAAGMAYYNFRVTGNALRLPYVVHEQTYSMAPMFVWQKPREIEYRNKQLHDFHDWQLGYYRRQLGAAGFLRESALKFRELVKAYFCPFLLFFPLLAALRSAWSDRETRLLAMAAALTAPAPWTPS